MTARKRRIWIGFIATRLAGACVDASVVAAAYLSATLLRFDFQEPRWGWRAVALCCVTVCAVYLASLLITGCSRLSWRRISVLDVPRYVFATLLAAGVLTQMRFVLEVDTFAHVRPPYSITVISFFLATAGIILVRYFWRVYCSVKIDVSRLLEREVARMDNSIAARYLSGKCVMVTGAGGTIGSETVRQVAEAGAKTVLMVERGERELYDISRSMDESASTTQTVPLLNDVADSEAMKEIFARFRPEVVIHAAAYKHVPIVEQNPREGWRNNFEATRSLAALAGEAGVSRFVLISTDKAVNPVSVMGKTKLEAEKAIMVMNGTCSTSFCAVRFGNVLGSSGSVVPLFKELISRRKSITVTHPDMQRYFMTVSEAVSLVLQAASRPENAIYTLDMGERVKIVDLAENMIRQAGYRPYIDIPIVFTGLRPGEKISEELDISEKSAYKTDMAKIYITRAVVAAVLSACAFSSAYASENGKGSAPSAGSAASGEVSKGESPGSSVEADEVPEGEVSEGEQAEKAEGFAKYRAIIDRQMFGSVPEGFDPNRSPANVKASRRSAGDGQELTKEQLDLQKSVRFSVLNRDESGTTVVGFSDCSDSKRPVHYYLKVGQTFRGWTVHEADIAKGTALLEKDGIKLDLTLGEQTKAAVSTGSRASSGNTAGIAGGLAERRRKRRAEMREEAERERKQREEAEMKSQAEREALRASLEEMSSVLRKIQEDKTTENNNPAQKEESHGSGN